MMLPWTRTVIATLAFVWIMVAWHQHENLEARERARVEELISRYCSLKLEPVSGEVRSAKEKERDECEIGLRSAGLNGRGLQISGSVDVTGNVGFRP